MRKVVGIAVLAATAGCFGRTPPRELVCPPGSSPLSGGRCSVSTGPQDASVGGPEAGLPDIERPDIGMMPDIPDLGPPDLPRFDLGGEPDVGPTDAIVLSPVQVTPPILDFGRVRRQSSQVSFLSLRDDSRTRSVQLRIEPPSPEVQLVTANVTVSPRVPVNVPVVYLPEALPTLNAAIVVESCGGACPVVVPLAGLRQEPGVRCQEVDAGQVQVSTCLNFDVPCENLVDQQVIFRPGMVSGPVAGRTVSDQFVVPPRDRFTIEVELCAPTNTGPAEGFLRGAFRFPGGIEEGIDSRLALEAVNRRPPVCQLDIPTNFDFGVANVGQTVMNSIPVRNAGTSRCILTSFDSGGRDFQEFAVNPPSPILEIPPAASFNLPVAFTPSATGARQATVEFNSNDPTRTRVSIPVVGTGRGASPTRFNIVRQNGVAPTLRLGRALSFTNNDDGFAREAIPFTFNFLGTRVTEVFVSTNGFISFSQNGIGSLGRRPIPSTNNPNSLVAWFWDDLILDLPRSSVVVSLAGTSPSRSLVFTFRSIRKFMGGGVPGADTELFAQIELREGSDEIWVHYGTTTSVRATSDFEAAVGYENSGGTIGADPLSCSPNCDLMRWPTNTLFRYVPI